MHDVNHYDWNHPIKEQNDIWWQHHIEYWKVDSYLQRVNHDYEMLHTLGARCANIVNQQDPEHYLQDFVEILRSFREIFRGVIVWQLLRNLFF